MPPVDYLRKWWLANSTAEERTAAEDKDATIEGAYAFIENFAQRAEEKNGACLPDQIVYDLCGIFMRICVDGDVYATAEEIAKEEAEEKERAERELKRKIDAEKKRIDAEAKEAARRAALTPEQREAEDREKAERAAKDAEEYFHITIQPEKDVVMMIVPSDLKDTVLHTLYRQVGLNTQGQGIAFSVPVDNVVGLTPAAKEKKPED